MALAVAVTRPLGPRNAMAALAVVAHALRFQPAQLGGIEIALAAGRAVVDRQAQLRGGLCRVAEPPVGQAKPEVKWACLSPLLLHNQRCASLPRSNL